MPYRWRAWLLTLLVVVAFCVLVPLCAFMDGMLREDERRL